MDKSLRRFPSELSLDCQRHSITTVRCKSLKNQHLPPKWVLQVSLSQWWNRQKQVHHSESRTDMACWPCVLPKMCLQTAWNLASPTWNLAVSCRTAGDKAIELRPDVSALGCAPGIFPSSCHQADHLQRWKWPGAALQSHQAYSNIHIPHWMHPEIDLERRSDITPIYHYVMSVVWLYKSRRWTKGKEALILYWRSDDINHTGITMITPHASTWTLRWYSGILSLSHIVWWWFCLDISGHLG